MKKIFYIPVLMLFAWSSCDVLDVQPYHSIPAELAITDSVQLESAITGSYDALQSSGYYGLNYIIFGDLPSDIMNHVGITVTWSEFDNNNILADNGLVESTWAAIYRVLNRVNNAIDQIPNISEEDLTITGRNLALAELRFLRALAHYDLARLFNPVPIRDQAVTNDEESLNPARRPLDEVFEVVNNDLAFAIQHLSPNIRRGRASQPAALALSARISLHLYYLSGDNVFLQRAIDHATEVIDHPALDLVPDFATLFSLEGNNESIFEVAYNEQDRNIIARYFAHTSLNGRYEFRPTDGFLNSFDNNDLRKDISVQMAGNNPFAVKFNDVGAGTDPVYVLRLAEMYLIRAEAGIHLERETAIIRSDINMIRERAGLQPITTTSYTALILEIEDQRKKEFAFEGHRWFDLVRTNRAVELLGNVSSVSQTLFPIPQAEIISNDNPGMFQNDDY